MKEMKTAYTAKSTAVKVPIHIAVFFSLITYH